RAVAGDLELAGDVDDLFLDAERGRLYAACGAGVLEVFERDPAKHGVAAWRSRERIPTSDGARTCLFVPEEDRLYLARPKRGERAASIGVYAPR
ncbi:MAG: hypothetical protein HZA53_19495, partial [Planctomycetes bacterium]|nr:hypothetical protein [Planctomycetota bacterium]